MKIDIITIFPEMFKWHLDLSLLKRARDKKIVEINTHDLRKWAGDERGTVDDRPYGGTPGMVLMIEPIVKALEDIKILGDKDIETAGKKTKTVLLSPRGKVWNEKLAEEYSQLEHLILICGRYEGVDERVKKFIDEEISIGDYILFGGEVPALVLIESIVRLIPKVVGNFISTRFESFSVAYKTKTKGNDELREHRILEEPKYTRPENFRGLKVPEILLSGNHEKIKKWSVDKAFETTKKVRPDLLK